MKDERKDDRALVAGDARWRRACIHDLFRDVLPARLPLRLAAHEPQCRFWLDEHAGIETVYAIASETPLLDIRGLLSKMEKAGKADGVRLSGDIDQRVQIVERSVGGLGKGKDASHTQTGSAQLQRIKKVTDVVTSTGAVVRAISFDHR